MQGLFASLENIVHPIPTVGVGSAPVKIQDSIFECLPIAQTYIGQGKMNGPADPLNYQTFKAETKKEKYANPLRS